MRATGFSTYPYKLAAFVISGGFAGLAGFLFAVKDGFVSPRIGISTTWTQVSPVGTAVKPRKNPAPFPQHCAGGSMPHQNLLPFRVIFGAWGIAGARLPRSKSEAPFHSVTS